MSTDKTTIGIANENKEVLAALVNEGRFGSELEAAFFAMAYAIKCGIRQGATEGAGTKWNIGSVDSDGQLRTLIGALFPETGDPYRHIEFLMNEGLKRLRRSDGLPPDVAGILFNEHATGSADN